MPKCIWEKEECELRAEGGEFYCLTHLQESKDAVWVFANAGDPPGTTRKLTPEELQQRKPLMSASRFLGFAWPPPAQEDGA